MPPRRKRGRYKLLQPETVQTPVPPRVIAIAIAIQWVFWFALAGVLAAFLLVLSVYLHWHFQEETWLRLWPASLRLITGADLSTASMVWATLENACLYAVFGLAFGALHLSFRALRHRRRGV
ncbi:MAG: hypothetical protein ACRD01_11775 [Terriglobales bacterium]